MENQKSQTHKPKTNYTMDDPKSQTPRAGELSGGEEGSGDSQSYLDQGISYLQQSVTGKSGQTKEKNAESDSSTSHHAAVDEADPEKISDFLRDQNRSMTKGEQGK